MVNSNPTDIVGSTAAIPFSMEWLSDSLHDNGCLLALEDDSKEPKATDKPRGVHLRVITLSFCCECSPGLCLIQGVCRAAVA